MKETIVYLKCKICKDGHKVEGKGWNEDQARRKARRNFEDHERSGKQTEALRDKHTKAGKKSKSHKK